MSRNYDTHRLTPHLARLAQLPTAHRAGELAQPTGRNASMDDAASAIRGLGSRERCQALAAFS